MILKTFLPFNLLNISGYAHSVVITNETIVQITVKITVQKNDFMYLTSCNTVAYASKFKPFGSKYTSCRIKYSVELKDLAKRFSIGIKQIALIMMQINTNTQSPNL